MVWKAALCLLPFPSLVYRTSSALEEVWPWLSPPLLCNIAIPSGLCDLTHDKDLTAEIKLLCLTPT